MGWLIFFAIILLVAVCPVGTELRYDETGFLIRIQLWIVKITIYPGNHKKKKKEKEKKSHSESENSDAKKQTAEKKGGSLKRFTPFLKLGLDFFKDLKRKIRVDHLVFKLTMAGDDPCDLALAYGKANGAVAGLMSTLSHHFLIRKQDVQVNCDFTAEETLVSARLVVTITIGRALVLGVRYVIRALKIYLKTKNQQESGANI